MKVVTTIRLEEDIKEALEQIASEDNRSFSNLVETILSKWLEDSE